MGSAILVFEAIVLGLSIPVSVVIYNVDTALAIWSTFLLMVLCILAVGGVRHDKRAAITTGLAVQAVIIAVGIFVRHVVLFLPPATGVIDCSTPFEILLYALGAVIEMVAVLLSELSPGCAFSPSLTGHTLAE